MMDSNLLSGTYFQRKFFLRILNSKDRDQKEKWNYSVKCLLNIFTVHYSVADPGFSRGGGRSRGGRELNIFGRPLFTIGIFW